MKHFWTSIVIAFAVTVNAAAPASARAGFGLHNFARAVPATALGAAQETSQLPEREVINRTFRLEANSRVEVSGIAGPVTVETTGGDTAEVHVVRLAQTERELRCYETLVKGASNSLSVRHHQFSHLPGCDSIRSRQQVTLRLPRAVELDLSTISGDVNVGAVEGVVRLSNIAGHVRVAEAQAAEINSLAKGLSMSLAQVSDRGIRIRGIVGAVELSLGRDVNADVRVTNVLGSVRSASPDITLTETGGGYRARAGTGGALISLSGINGSVRLRRL